MFVCSAGRFQFKANVRYLRFGIFDRIARAGSCECAGDHEFSFAANWIEAYKTYISTNPPVSRLASLNASEPPLNSDQVWVNTRSGKYWKPGSRYFGKTKQGEYMSEKEAVHTPFTSAARASPLIPGYVS